MPAKAEPTPPVPTTKILTAPGFYLNPATTRGRPRSGC